MPGGLAAKVEGRSPALGTRPAHSRCSVSLSPTPRGHASWAMPAAAGHAPYSSLCLPASQRNEHPHGEDSTKQKQMVSWTHFLQQHWASTYCAQGSGSPGSDSVLACVISSAQRWRVSQVIYLLSPLQVCRTGSPAAAQSPAQQLCSHSVEQARGRTGILHAFQAQIIASFAQKYQVFFSPLPAQSTSEASSSSPVFAKPPFPKATQAP